jgi:surface protein
MGFLRNIDFRSDYKLLSKKLKELHLKINRLFFCVLLSTTSLIFANNDSTTSKLTNVETIYFENGTCKCPEATVGDVAYLSTGGVTRELTAFTVVDNSSIATQIAAENYNLCTTLVTDMEGLFQNNSSFNSDISFWDTSNVTTMKSMFKWASAFNEDISDWDVSNVTDFEALFWGASVFNQDIGGWNTSSVTNMESTFEEASAFNQDISTWVTSNVTNMRAMFESAIVFNQNINGWDTSNVTTMLRMFDWASTFNGDIGSWDTSNVTDMRRMFKNAKAFDQDITSWNMSNVTNINYMFSGAENFDQEVGLWDIGSVTTMLGVFENASLFNNNGSASINKWDTSSVTNMGKVFLSASDFNQDISDWDTSAVTDMSYMFQSASVFNQNIGSWVINNVTTMQAMFNNADAFNQNINSWDTSSVTNMGNLFSNTASFNQDLNSWDTSNVTNMFGMLGSTLAFNGDIGSWDTSAVTNMSYMFQGSSVFNRDISEWDTSSVTNMTSMFSSSQEFNQDLSKWCVLNITTKPQYFVGNIQSSDNLPVWGTCNKTVYFEDNTCMCPDANVGDTVDIDEIIYTVVDDSSIGTQIAAGNFNLCTTQVTNMKGLFKNNTSFNSDISFWDTSNVTNMYEMFGGATEFNQTLGNWDTSNVTTMKYMFSSASAFNQEIGDWDTSSVTDMSHMFGTAVAFNQNIDAWDTSSVTNMQYMFNGAITFDQPLNSWDTSSVTAMDHMFRMANVFNQDLNDWDLKNVTSIRSMFIGAYAFNGIISDWNTENITDMTSLFYESFAFNQDIGNWNVSSVTDMFDMFKVAKAFDQDISKWDVSSVTTMGQMFLSAKEFNQNIGRWDVSNVTNMNDMFSGATNFNQNLTSWCVSNISSEPESFKLNSGLTNTNLPIWGTCNELIYFEDNTCMCPTATVGDTEVINGITYTVVDDSSISTQIAAENYNICTTLVTDMTELFQNNTLFNSDIGFWDTTNVTAMTSMFEGASSFNQNIGSWNLSSLTTLRYMFFNAASFNQDISSWNISNVIYIDNLFNGATEFNQDIGGWDTSNVLGMSGVFANGSFNKDISNWDTSSVDNMESMFLNASDFNQNIDTWDTSSVISMRYMFSEAIAFDQPLNSWDTSKVTNMRFMFQNASSFNQDIGNWDTSNIQNLSSMFSGATLFNQNIGDWDLSNNTSLEYLFEGASAFNQDIGNWDISGVTNMMGTFVEASSFNQDLSSWDTSNVITMDYLFRGTPFNKDISDWNTSNVIKMDQMFFDASDFNQNISSWDISSVTTMYSMFRAASAFNQNIGAWNTSSVTNMDFLFYEATVFDQDLTDWCVTNITSEPELFTHEASEVLPASALKDVNKPLWGKCPGGGLGSETPSIGDGSSSSPYEISSFSNLLWISEDSDRWDKHYIQTNDIEAGITSSLNNGLGWSPIGDESTGFSGSYNGQGYYIFDLKINRPTQDYIGLFGEIKPSYGSSSLIVKDIYFENANIIGAEFVGVLAGNIEGLSINNYVQVQSVFIGDSYVAGDNTIGGLAGRVYNHSTVTRCYYEGNVVGGTGDSSDYQITGGLIGNLNYYSNISKSYSSGSVSGNYMVGGLLGKNSYSNLSNNYSRSKVSASYNAVGGLIGWDQVDDDNSGRVNNYSTGAVSLSSNNSGIGGLIGYQASCDTCSIEGDENYWSSDLSSTSSNESENGIDSNVSSSTLKTLGENEEWDFDYTWITSGNINDGYPFLRNANEIGISDISFDQSNNGLSLVFYEGIPSDETLLTTDFELDLIVDSSTYSGNATLTSANPTAVSISEDRNTVTITVSYTGEFNGSEMLSVGPGESEDDYDDDIYLTVSVSQLDLTPPTLSAFTINDSDFALEFNQETIIIASFSESMANTPTIQFSNDTLKNHLMSPYLFGKETLDQQNLNSDSGAGGTDQWQSFTASTTGRLTKVEWEMGNPVIDGDPQPVTIKLYSGLGTSGNLLAESQGLYTPAFNDANGNSGVREFIGFDVTDKNIDVTQGDVLTMQLVLTSGNINVGFLPLSVNNPYAGGKAGNDDSWDYIFKTHIRPVSINLENWIYKYTAPDSYIPSISASVSGTDLYGNNYTGTKTINFTVIEESVLDTSTPTLLSIESSNSSSEVLNNDLISIIATFSEAMIATPTIHLSGVDINTTMSATSSASIWTYFWKVSSTVSTEVTATVSGTDLAGNPYTGTDSLTFNIVFELPDYLPSVGLVAWYPFNGNANDKSGNGNNGTLNGPTLSPDRNDNNNSSYSFDGSDDFISIGNDSSLNPDGSLTFSSWFNLDNLNYNNNTIIGRNNNNSGSDGYGYNYGVLIDSNNNSSKLRVGIGQQSNGKISDVDHVTTINPNEWIHYAITYDESKAKFYINGTQVHSTNLVRSGGNHQNDFETFIGKYRPQSSGNSTANQLFTGKLDDIGIWNRTLTPSEIAQLYTGVIDTVSPTVTISHNASSTTSVNNGDSITVTATFSEAMSATPTIHISGVDINTAMSATNSASVWTYNWTVSSTISTEVTATVSGTDLSGNSYTGTDTLSFSIYVDNEEPKVTLTNSGTKETFSDGDEIEITATFSEAMNATPTIHLSGVDINTAMSATNSASVWTYNWTVSSTVSTEVTATVSGTDLSGNSYTGTDTLSFSIYVDNEEPKVTLTNSGTKETFSDGDEIEITATFSEAMSATPTIHLSGVDINTAMSATNSASVWTYNWTVSSTVSTEVTATVSGTDLSGNSYTGTSSLAFVIDNTAPEVELTDDQEDQWIKSGDEILINAVFSESLSNTPTIQISNSNQTESHEMSESTTQNNWTYIIEVSELNFEDGAIYVEINSAPDASGNELVGTSSLTYILDNTATEIELSSTNSSENVRSGEEILIKAFLSEAVLQAPTIFVGNINQKMTATDTPTIWNYLWEVPQEPNTSYTASVVVIDNAGNKSFTDTSQILNYIVDDNPPVIENISMSSSNGSVTIQFSDDVFSSYENNIASGELVREDFNLEIDGGTASLVNSTPDLIEFDTDSYILFFSTEGITTGSEKLTVNINANSIFDSAGNTAETNQASATIYLFDVDAPRIIEGEVVNNTTLSITLNELAYLSDQSSISSEDLSLSLTTGTATLANLNPETLTQEGTNLILTFTIEGLISENQKLLIQLLNPIQDVFGNITSSFNENNTFELIPDSDQDGIVDEFDLCSETPLGEEVDENGCSFNQRDDDKDGVVNGLDECNNTPRGEDVDAKGCSSLQNDLDQDGVINILDQCPETEEDSVVNENGCALIQIDEDLDGVLNVDDKCFGTKEGVKVDENGCSRVQKDQDLDGVLDDFDSCPDSEIGVQVDESGCSIAQKDRDLDGVENDIDQCPETPLGELVDEFGCSQKDTEILEEDKDDDNDGVPNTLDRCNDSPIGALVDSSGCTIVELEEVSVYDEDFDGVPDTIDSCPGTEKGKLVNEFGCSLSEIDTDYDKVMDDVDLCPDTPLTEKVNEHGCSESQLENDFDLDGVENENDLCNDTPIGEIVNEFGCTELQIELDKDLDGVLDSEDKCLNTELGLEVNEEGCHEGQLDDDQDGVENQFDRCPETILGDTVDENGCSEDQLDLDDDGDGVKNKKDYCANTPAGTPIDLNGCPYNPPTIYSNQFERIETKNIDMELPVNDRLGKIIAFDNNPPLTNGSNEVGLTIVEGGDSDYFKLEGNIIYLTSAIDFEDKKLLSVKIRATNSRGISAHGIVKLRVLDIPNTYTFSPFSIGVFNVSGEAGSAKVDHSRYYNPNVTKGVGKWKIKKKISGGADAGLFTIRSPSIQKNGEGESDDYLDFIVSPDYDNPQDHNRDNIYEVEVINVNTEDGDTNVPVVVTQTNLVVPEGIATAIQLQTVAVTPIEDTDGDGVVDILDNSPLVYNPNQEDSDGDGVGDVSDDADHDGVWNPFDRCSDTPYGSLVNNNGCVIFYLPPSNFSLSKTEKCQDTNSISLSVEDTSLTYQIDISGAVNQTQTLNSSNWSLDSLSQGSYSICVTVDGVDASEFERCFDITINEPQPLSVYASSNKSDNTVSYKLSGGESYSITHNGITEQTTASEYTVCLDKGVNTVSITTGVACQGIFEQSYFSSDAVVTAPNPFNDNLAVYVGGTELEANIELYSSDGRTVMVAQYALTATERTVYINTSSLISGSYIIKVNNASVNQSQIVIKE